MIKALLAFLLLASPAWAEPTAPTLPTAVPTTIAPALCTVAVSNLNDLRSYITGASVGGSSVTGCGAHTGPWFGDKVQLAVSTYDLSAIAGTLDLPVAGGTSTGGTGFISTTSRPAASVRPPATVRPARTTAPSIAAAGDNYVCFVSANIGSIAAEGTRVAYADASNMPTIIAPTAAQGQVGAFTLADNAHHYCFQGINATGEGSGAYALSMFYLRSPSEATDSTTMPHDIILDRVLCHGGSTLGAKQCLLAGGSNIAVINSRVYDIFETGSECGGECHGLLFSTGSGPYLIDNSEVITDGIHIFVGDSLVAVWTGGSYGVGSAVIPSDITITRNWLHRPWSWDPNSVVYSTGTAAISANGLCVTLTGAVASGSWVNDYFALTDAGSMNSTGYTPANVRLISAVGSCNGANSLTLATAYPDNLSGSGLKYRVTLYAGVHSGGSQKNVIEQKSAFRTLVKWNVIENSPDASQKDCIDLASVHGNGAGATDITVTQNYIRNCFGAIGGTFGRPRQGTGESLGDHPSAVASDGTTNCSGGGCVKLTFAAPINSGTGDTADILNISGTTEANGTWPITRTSSTSFTIPVAFVNTYTAGTGSVVIYNSGTPTMRIAVTENVIEDPGACQISIGCDPNSSGVSIASYRPLMAWQSNPVLSPTGGDDAATSTVGHWRMDDINISHNTVVGPQSPADFQASILQSTFNVISGSSHTTAWKGKNFTLRNNLFKMSNPNASAFHAISWVDNNGGFVNGTASLDKWTETASRQVAYNAFYYPSGFGVATELAAYSGSDDDTLAMLADATKVGFTSYTSTPLTTGDVTNYALTNLYTWSNCSASSSSATVTCSGATIPTTVVKGTPFKVDSDGNFGLVLSRDSATQVTLQANYHATVSGQSTFGFKGWSTTGADPGADVSALATAISGVVQ